MRKILLTSVGVAALAVGANATDFTLSGTAKVKIDDAGDSSVDISTAIGVSKTFDNGMVLSLSNNNMANGGELTLTSDAISVTFGDIDQNEKNPGLMVMLLMQTFLVMELLMLLTMLVLFH